MLSHLGCGPVYMHTLHLGTHNKMHSLRGQGMAFLPLQSAASSCSLSCFPLDGLVKILPPSPATSLCAASSMYNSFLGKKIIICGGYYEWDLDSMGLDSIFTSPHYLRNEYECPKQQFYLLVFEAESHCVVLPGLELTEMSPSLLPEHWD